MFCGGKCNNCLTFFQSLNQVSCKRQKQNTHPAPSPPQGIVADKPTKDKAEPKLALRKVLEVNWSRPQVNYF